MSIHQIIKRKVYLEVELTATVPGIGQHSRELEIEVQNMIIALMKTVQDQEEQIYDGITIRNDIWTDPLKQ